MRLFVVGLAAGVAVGLAGLALDLRADQPGKQAKADPAKEFAAIQKDWSDAQQAFSKAYQAAKTNEERGQILKEKRPKPADFAERFLKLAEAQPQSPQAIQALAWVIANAGGSPAGVKALPKLKEKLAATTDLDQLYQSLTGLPAYNLAPLAPQIAEKAKKNLDHPKAVPLLVWVCSATQYGGLPEVEKLYNGTVDFLTDRFVERKELAPLAGWLAQDDDPPWAEKQLRRLLEKNPSDVVKAEATFGLGSVLKNKDEASQPEAEKLLQTVIEAKTAVYSHLVERAKKELEDLKLRGIGKPAPDISGEDLDGKALKLSDYKGKVVLLDFWGFW